jgi:hypothetical protein
MKVHSEKQMNLFEFELAPVDQIEPWGKAPNLSLSWFALTDGVFKLNAGKHELFRYSNDIIQHWNLQSPYPDYQIAAFAGDFLNSVAQAITPLPDFLQPLAWNWDLLRELLIKSKDHDEHYDAFHWLAERSPWPSYLHATPEISFIRKDRDIMIAWDNRHCMLDNMPVWQEEFGTHFISVDNYIDECQSFADRLLEQMLHRIDSIASGNVKPQISVDCADLLRQHETWKKEFADYFVYSNTPDTDWDNTKGALIQIISDLKFDIGYSL